jgi:hypothetical protein
MLIIIKQLLLHSASVETKHCTIYEGQIFGILPSQLDITNLTPNLTNFPVQTTQLSLLPIPQYKQPNSHSYQSPSTNNPTPTFTNFPVQTTQLQLLPISQYKQPNSHSYQFPITNNQTPTLTNFPVQTTQHTLI